MSSTIEPGRHGGNHYGNDGCRCDICTAAHRLNMQRARARRRLLAAEGHMPPHVKHGSNSTYQNWYCRCDCCRAAHTESRRS